MVDGNTSRTSLTYHQPSPHDGKTTHGQHDSPYPADLPPAPFNIAQTNRFPFAVSLRTLVKLRPVIFQTNTASRSTGRLIHQSSGKGGENTFALVPSGLFFACPARRPSSLILRAGLLTRFFCKWPVAMEQWGGGSGGCSQLTDFWPLPLEAFF